MSKESFSILLFMQTVQTFLNMPPPFSCDFWVTVRFMTQTLGIQSQIQNEQREVALTIRRGKIRAFQICIHFYCTIIGSNIQKILGIHPKMKNEPRECSTRYTTQENLATSGHDVHRNDVPKNDVPKNVPAC